MEKIKTLLLPLALVFAAIAVFEFGARYGATNMRAYAIASELQFPLSIYEQAESNMDISSKEHFASMIDNGIAAGAMHRTVWYINKDARTSLDKVLTRALIARGDAVTARFDSMENNQEKPILNQSKLSEIRKAVVAAKAELVDNTAQDDEEKEIATEE